MASPYGFGRGWTPQPGQLVYKSDPRKAGRVIAVVGKGEWGQVKVHWLSGRETVEENSSLQDLEARATDYEQSLADYQETLRRLSDI